MNQQKQAEEFVRKHGNICGGVLLVLAVILLIKALGGGG